MAQDPIETLNSLLKTTIDSVNGFENSAKELQSERLRQIFRERADQRQNVVQELREEIRRLGGDPAEGGSMMGKMHHVWEDLKGAVTNQDEEATINQTEAAEDYLKNEYESALNELDGQPRQVVERCYQQVRQGHDQISQLKHGMQTNS